MTITSQMIYARLAMTKLAEREGSALEQADKAEQEAG